MQGSDTIIHHPTRCTRCTVHLYQPASQHQLQLSPNRFVTAAVNITYLEVPDPKEPGAGQGAGRLPAGGLDLRGPGGR